MSVFHRVDGRLHCESVDLDALASLHGTPLYVYSQAEIVQRYREVRDAFAEFDPLVCFSVKSNSNLAILDLLKREGSGFDVVSHGELARALRVGASPETIVFAGVGKTDAEIEAGLEARIAHFDVESEPELRAIDAIARNRNMRAHVLLRVNPDVDAATHHHITTGKKENKFGIDFDTAARLVRERERFEGVEIEGFHSHIGSQITTVAPFVQALDRIGTLIEELRATGARLPWLNFGGGIGIAYQESAPKVAEIANAIAPRMRSLRVKLILEPGRYIVGGSGALIGSVVFMKRGIERTFAILDTGMSELLRPALYDAWHDIQPLLLRPGVEEPVEVVGPICESSDVIGRARELPPLVRGDRVAILQAGAYGFSMASNYNSRPRPAEILVDGTDARVVRVRESLGELMEGERF